MPNPSFDAIVTTTLKNYRKNLADAITAHQILWFMLKEKGFIREDEGGTSIVEPLLVGRNNTVKSYHGYDIIDTTPQEGISAAEYEWKQIAGSVTISGREEFQNQGQKTKILSLLESKVQQLQISMRLEVNRMLQGDGTGNGGKDFTGLGVLVEEGSAWSIVGGIDSNAHPYWRNQWLSVGTVQLHGTPNFSPLLNAMRTLYNSCSRQTVKPTILLSSQAVFETYEASLTVNERWIDTKLGDAGFANLMYKGTPFAFDEDMPNAGVFPSAGQDTVNQELLMLNSDFLRFVIGKGKNFVVSEMMKPENQDAKVSHVILYGNATTNNRARQGRLTNIDLDNTP